MTPIIVPNAFSAYARDYLRLLDEAIVKTVDDAQVTSESYRNAAKFRRQIGKLPEADEADVTADEIERDPRLHVARVMHSHTVDGTAKYFLHLYLELLNKQASPRDATPRAATQRNVFNEIHMKRPSPYTYRVDIDRDGYVIVDEDGADIEPTRRYTTWLAAAARLREIIDDEIEAKKQETTE